MKKIAIIGAGQAGYDYAINAKEIGVETHCFSLNDAGAVAKDVVDFFYEISIFEKDEILRMCREIGIDGVLATTELTIEVASYLAMKLGVLGVPHETAKNITDKYYNRRATKDVDGLNHPKYIVASTENEIIESDLSYPIILKPTARGGKKGISVVRNPESLADALEYAFKEQGNENKIIVEEYIEGGMEFSVESLSYRGRNYVVQVTQKQSSGPPHCVELGHHQPAHISDDTRKKIETVIDRALTALNLQNGPCHTEIKVVDGKVYLIEFNARPGGDCISYPLTDLSSGYHYLQASIMAALDDFTEPDFSKCKKQYAGLFFVTEQTSELIPIFNSCTDYSWCYKKEEFENGMDSYSHNFGRDANYFIYCSEEMPKELAAFVENE